MDTETLATESTNNEIDDEAFDPATQAMCDGCTDIFDHGELEGGRCTTCLDDLDEEDSEGLDEITEVGEKA